MSIINKSFFEKLKSDYSTSEIERRRIIGASNDVLHASKRAIFSLHRGDNEAAKVSLGEIEARLQEMEKGFGLARLYKEGAYQAGVEEYAEARLFYDLIDGGEIKAIEGINLAAETYIGGLSDVTGELVRRAVNKAAAGETDEAIAIKTMVDDIMAELVLFDFTGYLRTKYDQAKGNLKKIEHIAYELKLRGK